MPTYKIRERVYLERNGEKIEAACVSFKPIAYAHDSALENTLIFLEDPTLPNEPPISVGTVRSRVVTMGGKERPIEIETETGSYKNIAAVQRHLRETQNVLPTLVKDITSEYEEFRQ